MKVSARIVFIAILLATLVVIIGTTVVLTNSINTLLSAIKDKPNIELPEEYKEISKDSLFQTPMTAYYKGDTLVLSFIKQRMPIRDQYRP